MLFVVLLRSGNVKPGDQFFPGREVRVMGDNGEMGLVGRGHVQRPVVIDELSLSDDLGQCLTVVIGQ